MIIKYDVSCAKVLSFLLADQLPPLFLHIIHDDYHTTTSNYLQKSFRHYTEIQSITLCCQLIVCITAIMDELCRIKSIITVHQLADLFLLVEAEPIATVLSFTIRCTARDRISYSG